MYTKNVQYICKKVDIKNMFKKVLSMYLKIVKCVYKKCSLYIQKIQNVHEKKLTPKKYV